MAVLICSIVAGSLSSNRVATSAPQQDVRIDVPADARIRIENQFGGVVASVWKENYVSVAATIEESGAPFTRSPIVIENKNKQLLISVVRTPRDPKVAIRLTVQIPLGSQAEFNTAAGSIAIHGRIEFRL